MLQDLRFALRLFGRHRGYAAAAIVTLAVGIGATTAMFTLVDAVLLRPLDIPAADRVVALEQQASYGPATSFLYRDYLAYSAALAARATVTVEQAAGVVVEASGALTKRNAAFVGANYFDVVGRPVVRGRSFTAADDRPGAEPVAIVGDAFWRGMLAADEHAVGRVLRIAGVPFTIVGIAAPGFRGTELRTPADLYLPAYSILRTTTIGRGAGNYYFQDGSDGWSPGAMWRIVGRLRNGVTHESVTAQLSGERIEAVPVQKAAVGPRVRGDVTRFTTVLLAAVVLVLTIACANLAGLTMARTEARRRDLAIRLAIGIERGRLVRQLLAECLLVAVAGAAAGFVLARWLIAGLSSFELPGFIPLGVVDYSIDLRILGFAGVLAVLTAAAVGVAPARMAARTDVLSALKPTARQADGARLRHLLIGGQVALTIVLLFGAGLFIRSLRTALDVPVGAETRRVAVGEPDLRSGRLSRAEEASYYQAAASRIASLPGVETVSWGTGPFILAGNSTPVVATDGQSIRLPKNVAEFEAGPDYFRTLGIPLTHGRDFTWQDGPEAPPVIVVNAAFARRFWGDADALGHRVSVPPLIHDAVVVGVAEDGRYNSLTESGRLAVFAPWAQGRGRPTGAVIVRTRRDAREMAVAIHNTLAGVDRRVLVAKVNSLADRVEQLVMPQRAGSWLLGSFAVFGVLLGIVGVHGLLAYLTVQRTHEIGVRMALGAGRHDVVRLVAGGVMLSVGAGVAVGLVASWWLAHVVERLLFGVGPHDPGAFAAAVAVICIAAGVGSAGAIRRATRVDPMIALRAE